MSQLDHILASEEFVASPKIQILLRYLVTATLDDDTEHLKGYTIGIDVFDRDESFDPMLDSIVRVQVGRLRKMLAHYYVTAGEPQKILIEIPKGQYGAVFTDLADSADDEPPPDDPSASPQDMVAGDGEPLKAPRFALWAAAAVIVVAALAAFLFMRWDSGENDQVPRPQIALLKFSASAQDPLALQLAEELHEAVALSLTRQQLFPVLILSGDPGWHDARQSTRSGDLPFLHVHAFVRRRGDGLEVSAQLMKTEGEQLLWTGSRQSAGDSRSEVDALAMELSQELHLRTILAVRDLMLDDPRANDTPWLLYLNAAWVPGKAEDSMVWEKQRVAYARRAVELDPQFGAAHAVLADKLAYLANVDTQMEEQGARGEAIDHARDALAYGSDDPKAISSLTSYYWHAGEMDLSEKMAQRTVALDPGNGLAAFQAIVHPYTCAHVPENVISRAERFDASMIADNPTRWVTQTWLNQLYLNNGDIGKAETAGRKSFVIFRTPDTSLRFAATLVAAGKVAEAREAVATIAPNWPHLNLHHYAETVIPRRCGSQNEASHIRMLYEQMAKAVCATMADAPACALSVKDRSFIR